MKSLLASLLTLAALCSPANADNRETATRLRTLYGQYNDALLQRNGDEAARQLHPAVLAMYADALALARSAGERGVHRMLVSAAA